MRKIKRPIFGELVLISRWSDKDMQDPWCIGAFSETWETETRIYYRVKQSERWFRHCWRITDAEAKQRLAERVLAL